LPRAFTTVPKPFSITISCTSRQKVSWHFTQIEAHYNRQTIDKNGSLDALKRIKVIFSIYAANETYILSILIKHLI